MIEHNEAQPREKARFQIDRLEERIAPSAAFGLATAERAQATAAADGRAFGAATSAEARTLRP